MKDGDENLIASKYIFRDRKPKPLIVIDDESDNDGNEKEDIELLDGNLGDSIEDHFDSGSIVDSIDANSIKDSYSGSVADTTDGGSIGDFSYSGFIDHTPSSIDKGIHHSDQTRADLYESKSNETIEAKGNYFVTKSISTQDDVDRIIKLSTSLPLEPQNRK